MPFPWFDAHLDLAYLASCGRDMTAALAALPPAAEPPAVTLPSLKAGGVHWCLATIFTESGSPQHPAGYDGLDDAAGARRAALRQLSLYQSWESAGLIRLVRTREDLAGDLGPPAAAPPRVILLMEGADPILSPDDAAWWYAQGLRVVGLSWRHGSRYAGGDATPPAREGLTLEGRTLLQALDALGIVHDLTHLDDRSAQEVLERAETPVVATHTASRPLVGRAGHRLISDDLVRGVGARGGMLGLVLYSAFLTRAAPGSTRRATVAEAADHAARLAELAGGRDRLGLGSDMDGGFGADRLPEGIDDPANLPKLTNALAARGWTAADLDGFTHANWLRFFARCLPARDSS